MGKKISTASRARTLAKHTPKTTVKASVDKGLQKRWSALIEEVRRAKGKEASGFDALWEAVGEIVDHDLHLIGGFKDAREFFERELGEKERNAYRFIKVARFASPRDEERYGVTKIDAALSFIAAKLGAPLEHGPLPIALGSLKIPVDGGTHKTLDDARVEDIDRASRALGKKSRAPTSSAERALTDHFATHQSFKGVRFRVRNGLVTIQGVPAAALTVFANVLRDVAWEDSPRPARPAVRGGGSAVHGRRGAAHGRRGAANGRRPAS